MPTASRAPPRLDRAQLSLAKAKGMVNSLWRSSPCGSTPPCSSERGEETKYKATVEEEGDADATIVITATRYFTNLLLKYVFSNSARMVAFKDVFSTSHQAVKLYTCYGHAFYAMTCQSVI